MKTIKVELDQQDLIWMITRHPVDYLYTKNLLKDCGEWKEGSENVYSWEWDYNYLRTLSLEALWDIYSKVRFRHGFRMSIHPGNQLAYDLSVVQQRLNEILDHYEGKEPEAKDESTKLEIHKNPYRIPYETLHTLKPGDQVAHCLDNNGEEFTDLETIKTIEHKIHHTGATDFCCKINEQYWRYDDIRVVVQSYKHFGK